MSEHINIPNEFNLERIKKYMQKHKEKGEDSKILSWTGIPNVYIFFYLYLFKKYKQSCLINVNYRSNTDTSNFVVLEFPNFKSIPTRDFTNKQINKYKSMFNEYGEHIAECIKTGKKMILIPLRIVKPGSGHANVLIYNKKFKELSLFEPHGLSGYYDGYYIDDAINYITKQINSQLSQSEKINYVPSIETCPSSIVEHAPGYSIINRFGIQLAQEGSIIKKEKKEGGGYCAIWSLFFAELSLANPELSTKDLYNHIYQYIVKEVGLQNAGNYLLYVARGYTKIVNEKLNKYFSILYDFYIDTDDYIKFVKKLNYKDGTLYDKITNAYLNIEFNIERDGFDRVYEGYNSLKSLPEYSAKLSNKEDPFTLELNILEKIKNKEMFKNITPLSNSASASVSSKSYSENINSSEIIINKMNDLINSPVVNQPKNLKPCKAGKERNANGRCVKIKNTTKQIKEKVKVKTLKVKPKPPCKPGKERNANGRCVKIKEQNKINEKESEIILSSLSSESESNELSLREVPKTLKVKHKPPCKPGKERNANGRCVKIKNITKQVKVKTKTKVSTKQTLKVKPKPPCKPGKERNANGRCVKSKNKYN
jgi:hypothetical protein